MISYMGNLTKEMSNEELCKENNVTINCKYEE